MNEREIHDLIEQQDPEAKQRIYDKVMQRIDFSKMEPPQQTVKAKSRRPLWITLSTVLACLVVLAIVLPITLQDIGGGERYCDDSQYRTVKTEQTLKEYSLKHNGNLLYVGWQDVAEEITTAHALNVADKNDIIYFNEIILNGETGEEIELYVTDTKTTVDKLSDFKNCVNEQMVNGIMVKWGDLNVLTTIATFTYGDYVYYMSLNVPNANEQIAEIVENMLQK